MRMWSKFRKLRHKDFCLNQAIPIKRFEELGHLYEKKTEDDIPDIKQINYDLTEELRIRWIRKYKKYMRGKTDYAFYDINLIIPGQIVRRINRGENKVNVDDEILFQLLKHPKNIGTERILRLCNTEIPHF